MSRFLICCGGTGGHLSPGIALAERLQSRGHECTLVISRKDVDTRLIQHYPDYAWVRLPGVGFSWLPHQMLNFGVQQLMALVKAFFLIRRTRPDVVIAFGGFLSVGVVLTAFVLRRPVVLHEANRVPGKAIRGLSGFAERVYLPIGVRLGGMPPQAVRHCGLPVRREIKRVGQENARRRMNIAAEGRVLVVLGGSQGAAILNQWVRDNAETIGAEGISVICITGLGKGIEGSIQGRRRDGSTIETRFLPFCDAMADLLSSADLVVSRAGAGTIAELIRCRVPSILVPLPTSADGHQLVNATFLERQGGCMVVQEERFDELLPEVIETIFNDWLLERIRTNLARLDASGDTERFVDDVIELAERGGRR